MGLPAELVHALDSLSAEGRTVLPKSLPRKEPRPALDFADGRFVRAAKILRQHLDELEARSRVLSEAASNLVEMASTLPASEHFDFSEAVDAIQKWEEDFKKIFLPDLRYAKKQRKEAALLPPKHRAMAIETVERQIQIYSGILRTIRDCRWQLMALRAKREDPGDAPVFDDPAALLQYLNAK